MRVFVAGGSGAIGRPPPQLIEHGHEPVATTRSPPTGATGSAPWASRRS